MLAVAIAAATMFQTATIKVFVVSFFPLKGDQIDSDLAIENHESYSDLKAWSSRFSWI